MRAFILLGMAIAIPCHAQPVSPLPWITGERLVKLLGNVDPATVKWTPDSPFRSKAIAAEYLDMSNGEFVRGYIQAVHDATDGRKWCSSQRDRPMPHELEADVRCALQRMSDTQLRRNAADLIVDIWRKRWPCAPSQRRGQ